MKVAAAFLALSHATEDPAGFNCWPANEHAPHCGCQLIDREKSMINSECTARWSMIEHPEQPEMENALQMLTVASSFPLSERTDLAANFYTWTGYSGMSHEEKHDIVFFFREDACWIPCKEQEYDADGNLMNNTAPEYNCPDGVTRLPIDMEAAMETWAEPEFNCNPTADGEPVPGPRLGNFNYDIARSHQSYNLPIYGLNRWDDESSRKRRGSDSAYVEINSHTYQADFDNFPVLIQNVTAHHGHGTVIHEDCTTNAFQYDVMDANGNHNGWLEYAQFELCEPDLSAADYMYTVPSSWTSTVTLL
ncbi:Oidioi.mRNA.OKI2018_I69.chr2.g4346.t1.cds [Oikopleura dioica]|uniref:Oidioi.mRNA.OKI2018_I69.chr2.g4346.t1.cds n=1 Tax=Oikopleura dioica TaxID=34765 RepID=A0ABN7T3H1_OIKDI|nr:Oidioi.mRNA.OKI2018_I69.chr2.g4346.t1.cds [Oikopleura dioica]